MYCAHLRNLILPDYVLGIWTYTIGLLPVLVVLTFRGSSILLMVKELMVIIKKVIMYAQSELFNFRIIINK